MRCEGAVFGQLSGEDDGVATVRARATWVAEGGRERLEAWVVASA